MVSVYLFKLLNNKAISTTIRNYAFKSDLIIKWVRPEKISLTDPRKSGDCSGVTPIDPKLLRKPFDKSKEMETAEPAVRSLFELGNSPSRYTSSHYIDDLVKHVQRHPYDFSSMEVKLARMTAKIRLEQNYLEKCPRNVTRKVQLKELVEKRKKYLKYLRRRDYACFEWILEKLDLLYKPPPPLYHAITRKESLQKLTNIHCNKLRQKKLNEYRKTLQEQQIPFLENAIKRIEFVRKEQLDLNIPVTITPEIINEYKAHLKELKDFQSEAESMFNKDSYVS